MISNVITLISQQSLEIRWNDRKEIPFESKDKEEIPEPTMRCERNSNDLKSMKIQSWRSQKLESRSTTNKENEPLEEINNARKEPEITDKILKKMKIPEITEIHENRR